VIPGRVPVVIIGGGPAGLLLARLLQLAGIESVILERQTRQYVMARVRAGVMERGTVAVLREAEAAERMDREGFVHEGVNLSFAGRLLRIDFAGLSDSSIVAPQRHPPVGAAGVRAGLSVRLARDLSETPPVDPELIYCHSERGFALCSMRHEMLSRYYVQCPLDDDVADWPDDRFWDVRFSWRLTTLVHRFPGSEPFGHRMQESELDYLARSPAAQQVVAEDYTGSPF
jgi:2-polyprenyl-6-methoxyphenol hydroxylase-like FAD-dependent oxidoreductase